MFRLKIWFEEAIPDADMLGSYSSNLELQLYRA